MTENYRALANWDDYEHGCPEGSWSGRLEQKAWGKSKNLILYFSEVATGRKYWFSVFHANGYKARDDGQNFRKEAEAGEVFELTTGKTVSGKPVLLSARKIS
jgi:hypothetical protein